MNGLRIKAINALDKRLCWDNKKLQNFGVGINRIWQYFNEDKQMNMDSKTQLEIDDEKKRISWKIYQLFIRKI